MYVVGIGTGSSTGSLNVVVENPNASIRILQNDVQVNSDSYPGLSRGSQFQLIYTVPNNTADELRFYQVHYQGNVQQSPDFFFAYDYETGFIRSSSSVNGSMRTETLTITLAEFSHGWEFDNRYDDRFFNLLIELLDDTEILVETTVRVYRP